LVTPRSPAQVPGIETRREEGRPGEDSSQGSGSSGDEAAGDASPGIGEASGASTARRQDGVRHAAAAAGEKRLLGRKRSEKRKEKT